MYFKQIFEKKLAQYSYLIGCQATGEAIIIDPMRDIDRYKKIAEDEGLDIVAAAETHIHADYLTGLREFAEEGVTIYASDEGDKDWKYEWVKSSDYNYVLVNDGDRFSIGNIHFGVTHTPGHTPEHVSYTVTDGAAANDPMGILTGDFIFVGDVGRPDLLETAAGQKGVMKSSARTLYKSVEQFKSMPEYLQVWPGHGSGSACGKALGLVPESTVGYELRYNPSIQASDDEQQFVDYILEGQPEPPLYFARMKRDNRSGPKVLGSLPNPQKMTVEGLVNRATPEGSAVVDTRERTDFMDAHLKGSLLSTYNKAFNTVVGSYVKEDEDIYLIIEEDYLEEAVRDLIRIGLDNIKGYMTPDELEQYLENSENTERVETITFDDAAELIEDSQYQALDVRKLSEFNEGHVNGAFNIAHTRLLERKQELDKDKTWLVYCRTGVRASVATSLLLRDGFNVKYVNDNVEPWLANKQLEK
ncbi:MBL fold metallo-hydrolase [Aliifodinibius salipaludis]|uniref:MBL fold metallo-hydrolase n=1 Tax=Fodinibius salipaludis TaxID=2032627 RepID=A0A2A2G9F8_9BACT|nr:MBL fold metallo-hydrolase [Aliifodinibius salipaludis]PAU93499.1 MBL fold metallo-hydrolase [Aliifodinibius salipaludis]